MMFRIILEILRGNIIFGYKYLLLNNNLYFFLIYKTVTFIFYCILLAVNILLTVIKSIYIYLRLYNLMRMQTYMLKFLLYFFLMTQGLTALLIQQTQA